MRVGVGMAGLVALAAVLLVANAAAQEADPTPSSDSSSSSGTSSGSSSSASDTAKDASSSTNGTHEQLTQIPPAVRHRSLRQPQTYQMGIWRERHPLPHPLPIAKAVRVARMTRTLWMPL